MPTTRLYTLQTHGTVTAFLPQFVRFLINDTNLFVGPNWSLISTFTSADGRRNATNNPHDLDAQGDGWASGSLTAGDWVVLRSSGSNNSNLFQLYIELESTTDVNFMMIPFNDFPSTGADVSPPLFPTTSFGHGSGTFSVMTALNSSASYSIIADEGMMALVGLNAAGSTKFWQLAGEINPIMASGSAGDQRAFIMKRTTATVGHPIVNTENFYSRLSPFDNKTVLTSSSGDVQGLSSGGTSNSLHDGIGQDVINQTILPVGLWFNDVGHKHFAGWLRNVYSVHGDLTKSGTISTPNSGTFMYLSNGTTPPQLCFPWNSASFSTQSLGHFIDFGRNSSGQFNFLMVDTFSSPEVAGDTVTVTSLASGSYDRQRLKITYPFSRRRPRYGTVTG